MSYIMTDDEYAKTIAVLKAVDEMECDTEWCGKSPSKNDPGLCQVCEAKAAFDALVEGQDK